MKTVGYFSVFRRIKLTEKQKCAIAFLAGRLFAQESELRDVVGPMWRVVIQSLLFKKLVFKVKNKDKWRLSGNGRSVYEVQGSLWSI